MEAKATRLIKEIEHNSYLYKGGGKFAGQQGYFRLIENSTSSIPNKQAIFVFESGHKSQYMNSSTFLSFFKYCIKV